MNNDRFKFKIWDKKEKEMSEWPGNGVLNSNYFFECLKDKNCIVLQCTNLKDKNGKLIFEGDIIKFGKNIYEVIWHKYLLSYELAEKDHEGRYDCFNLNYDFNSEAVLKNDSYEIVGNIYENPKLLNQPNQNE